MSSNSFTGAGETPEAAGSGGSSRSELDVGYCGWVYHLGVNSIGHEYCHLRFLLIRGKCVYMYKRDPRENPGIRPIRKGVISHTLMVEDLGRRKVNNGDLYVLRFYNRFEHSKRGEIACSSPGEAHKWMEAFEQAKQQAELDILSGNSRRKLSTDDELNLDGHRPRVRRYAKGLRELIKIGRGPEMLLRKSSNIGNNINISTPFGDDMEDVIETHKWQCVRASNGIRLFEDVAYPKGAKCFLLKSVGVIEAEIDTVFEVILSLDRHKRSEWDMLTNDLELVESVDGHCDVVYGTYVPKYLSWWQTKSDFVFSRQWFHAQDGSYTILQSPVVNKKQPSRSGYRRTSVNPSTWEIKRLNTSNSSTAKCLVAHTVEVHSSTWSRWTRNFPDFEKTTAYVLLFQVAGLKEFFGANPSLTSSSSIVVASKTSDVPISHVEFEDGEVKDEFYDAIAGTSSFEDDDSDDDDDIDDNDPEVSKAGKVKLKNVSWAIASLALKRSAASVEKCELDVSYPSSTIDLSQFHGSLHQGKGETGTNCWSTLSGQGFMVRGKTYLQDYSKIPGGDPLLKLIAVDWFKADDKIDKVALHSRCLVQSEAGKKLPFILIVNLEIPSEPDYSLVLYYAADKPVRKESLLGRFVDGTDAFRDARFKLIPRIVEGYWMVKRAVGTKACLLGKAVTCRYLRQENFLEIDVDIGSSSVARSILSLILGYITSIVVDLAILIEAKEENELPEYILGTARLNRLKLDSAVQL